MHTKYNDKYIFRWYLSYYDLWGPFTVASAGMKGNLLMFSTPLGRDKIKFHLANGRRIIVPIQLLPQLQGVEPEELSKWEIIDDGKRIVFDSNDLILGVEDILRLAKARPGFRSKPELTGPLSGQAS